MMSSRRFLLSLFFLSAALWGCAEEPASTPAPAQPRAAVKAPAKQVPAPEVAMEEKEKPPEEEFAYDAEGRRDPFLPLTAIRKPVGPVRDEPQTPLQQFEVQQYRLIGVIIGMDEPRAMVVAPDGKSYLLKQGVKIGKNNGVIVDITRDVIQVEEKYYDFSGNVRTNILDITVPKREGV